MEFFIVDVFAERKYSGNQLAVFVCDSPLSDQDMQRMAREINFSESTFILSTQERDGGFDVRIFTPAHEVDFAGHPTLGTAHVLNRLAAGRPLKRVTLNLKVGPIPVDLPAEERGTLWMDQGSPIFGETLPAAALAAVLDLPLESIDSRYPVQQVSTGLPHILVPLRSIGFLQQAKVERTKYFSLIERTWAKNILVFTPQGRTASHDISVRMFADYLGISEDPATGSGNGCLAGYLVKHRVFAAPRISLTVGQGHEIGRPSLLFLRSEERRGGIHIAVGGRVFDVAKGRWDAAAG